MGKPTGFVEWQRVLPTKKPVAELLGGEQHQRQARELTAMLCKCRS